MLANIIGWLGTILVLVAYFQVNQNKWSADSKIFQTCNLFGSTALIYKAYTNAVWPSAVLNLFWALIALTALFKLKTQRPPQT